MSTQVSGLMPWEWVLPPGRGPALSASTHSPTPRGCRYLHEPQRPAQGRCTRARCGGGGQGWAGAPGGRCLAHGMNVTVGVIGLGHESNQSRGGIV